MYSFKHRQKHKSRVVQVFFLCYKYAMEKKRQVRIKHYDARHMHTFAVEYVVRKKHQRYWAAQFDSNITELDYVVEWVKNQPELELVP